MVASRSAPAPGEGGQQGSSFGVSASRREPGIEGVGGKLLTFGSEASAREVDPASNCYRSRSEAEGLTSSRPILGVCSLATFAEPSVRYGHARAEHPVDC